MDTTDPRSWSEIERLLDAALDLPVVEREAWVRASASRVGIADYVLDLLAREQRIGDFLEDGAAAIEFVVGTHSSTRWVAASTFVRSAALAVLTMLAMAPTDMMHPPLDGRSAPVEEVSSRIKAP